MTPHAQELAQNVTVTRHAKGRAFGYTLHADSGPAVMIKGRSLRPYTHASIYRRDGELWA